jgi:hypothetical protein
MQQYLDIVKTILEHGQEKQDRTGIGTIAIPGALFQHDLKNGFPLLTTKKIPFRLIASELEFFIKGITDKQWLLDRNNHIWDEWANPKKAPYGHDEASKERMKNERDLGPVYGLGSPEEYEKVNLKVSKNQNISRNDFLRDLIDIHFERTTADLTPGMFRAVGNTVEIMPVNEKIIFRIEILDGKINQILKIDAITREIISEIDVFFLFPARHFISTTEQSERAFKTIKEELKQRLKVLEKEKKPLEDEKFLTVLAEPFILVHDGTRRILQLESDSDEQHDR